MSLGRLVLIALLGCDQALHVGNEASGSDPGGTPAVTPERWRLLARQCSTKDTWAGRSQCMDEAVSLLPNMTGSQDVVDYFFKAKPYPGVRLRSPSCSGRHIRGGKNNYRGDFIWNPAQGGNSSEPCLWGNMPFGKSIEIILMARALGATHIIESGRMGGLSLLHYKHFGFKLTSVELLPVRHVEASLRAAHPDIDLLDGDGMRLVPAALAVIRARDPAARVAVILDGPKGPLAVNLTRTILKEAVLVVLDDQAVRQDIGGPSCTSNSSRWRSIFPMRRDRAAVLQPPNPHAAYKWDAEFYFKDDDISTLILGGAA